MDWKNVLEGAGNIQIFEPREPLDASVERMKRLVTERSKNERIGREQALRRIVLERRIGQCVSITLLASALILSVVFAHAGRDNLSFACSVLFALLWIGPKCAPLPDAAQKP